MKGLAARLQATLPLRVVKAYGQSRAGNYAAGLAFRAFLTMFPLMLGVLAVVGIVIHDPADLAKVQSLIVAAFPADAQPQLLQALHGTRKSAGWLSVVSVLGLIWTGTGLFASMEFALTEVFGSKQRDALRQRVMGLIMMVLFVAAVLVTVSANSAVSVIPFMPVGGFVIGAAVMIALLVAVYRFVPNRTFALRDVIPGALLAGVLIQVLAFVFPIYSRVAHGFNTYGQQFALFFLLATWLFFLCQLLLLGAVFIRMRVGAPATEGVVAAPGSEAEGTPRPVDAVKQQKGEPGAQPGGGERASSDATPAPRSRPAPISGMSRTPRGRVIGYLLLAGIFAKSVIDRDWRKSRRPRVT